MARFNIAAVAPKIILAKVRPMKIKRKLSGFFAFVFLFLVSATVQSQEITTPPPTYSYDPYLQPSPYYFPPISSYLTDTPSSSTPIIEPLATSSTNVSTSSPSYDDSAEDILVGSTAYAAAMAALASEIGANGITPIKEQIERLQVIEQTVALPPFSGDLVSAAESRKCKKIRTELEMSRMMLDATLRDVNGVAEDIKKLKEKIKKAQTSYNDAFVAYQARRVGGSNIQTLNSLRNQLNMQLAMINLLKKELSELEAKLAEKSKEVEEDVKKLKDSIKDLEKKYKDSGCIKEVPSASALESGSGQLQEDPFDPPRPPFTALEMQPLHGPEDDIIEFVFLHTTPTVGEVTPIMLLDPEDAFTTPLAP